MVRPLLGRRDRAGRAPAAAQPEPDAVHPDQARSDAVISGCRTTRLATTTGLAGRGRPERRAEAGAPPAQRTVVATVSADNVKRR